MDKAFIFTKYFYRLDNNGVQKQVAQATSCLGVREFGRTLKLVQNALASNLAHTPDARTTDTRISGRLASDLFYESLVQKAGIRLPQDTIVGWLKKAERDLTIYYNEQFKSNDQDVKKGIFVWFCGIINDQKVGHPFETDSLLTHLRRRMAN